MKQLELPFDKEIESQRCVKDINGEYIYVKLKDRYEIQVGDYVQINGKEIGLVKKVMKSLIIMAYVWHGEKISIEEAYYVPEVHTFEKLSKFRISELENVCKKHGYIIKGFEKVPYKAFADKMCDLTNPFYVASKTIEQSIKICSTVQRIKEYKRKKQELKNTLTQLNETLNKLNKLL